MEDSMISALAADGVDVYATVQRFGGNEALFLKYLKRFPSEPTFAALTDAVQRNDAEAVNITCHTLKGISGNLGLAPLFEACVSMMAVLRAPGNPDSSPSFAHVCEVYQKTVDWIQNLE